MYLRAIHAEGSIPVLREFIEKNPLGILTTAIPSKENPLIQSSHIPWVLDVDDAGDRNSLPKLRRHLARQNPQAKAMTEEARASCTTERIASGYTLKEEVLVLFNGPAHHYVTPKFYGKTKPETGKVVPTWNYTAVQAYGRATVYIDHVAPESTSFLNRQIRDLSQAAETGIMGYSKPWEVDDAPPRYIDLLAKNIIGVEIEVTHLGGKFKMSQEMEEEDTRYVIEGFKNIGTDVANEMAAMTEERLALQLSKNAGK